MRRRGEIERVEAEAEDKEGAVAHETEKKRGDRGENTIEWKTLVDEQEGRKDKKRRPEQRVGN